MFDVFVKSHLFNFLLFGGAVYALQFNLEAESFSPPTMLLQANELFDATLYNEAIPLYQQILAKTPFDLTKMEVKYSNEELVHTRAHLIQAYLLTENFSEVINHLKTAADLSHDELYFLALAYNKSQQPDLALKTLHLYLNSKEPPPLKFFREALFEEGLAYFSKKMLKQASENFTKIASDNSFSRLSYLAHLYLARIDLLQENYQQAQQGLNFLSENFPVPDRLHCELAYLQGETHFQLKQYEKAAYHFEKAIPEKNPERVGWYPETLYQLGWSYLKIADDLEKEVLFQKKYFEKAETTLNKLRLISSEERVILALGQFYLCRAKHLKEESAYQEAELLLSKQEYFVTREAQAHALLLRAEAASSYTIRDALYRHLTAETHQESSFFAKGWYLRGLNDFEEGQKLLTSQRFDEARKIFNLAANSFKKAHELLYTIDPGMAGLALKYQAQACYHQNTQPSRHESLSLLNSLLNQQAHLLASMEHPDEIFYLSALVALQCDDEESQLFQEQAEKTLQLGISHYPDGKFKDALLKLQGTLYYQQNKFSAAESIFEGLAQEHPHSKYVGEALLAAARSAEQIPEHAAKSKQYRQQLFTHHPLSPQAAEAYFLYYSYGEYLQGDRLALKHLQALPEKYPHSNFAIQAYYLIGLDLKRDRKTPEGKWIRKKNLNSAIDFFQAAESTFDSLYQKGKIADNEVAYFTSLRYRATLERALANLAIADESQGAKRQIFLEYAEEVFREMLNNFSHSQLDQMQACASMQEECSYWLAQAYVKGNKDSAAEDILENMLEKARLEKITRGYFLSRAWYEKGLMAMRQNQHAIALQAFAQSEDAAKGKILNTDQKLDLWIQQSGCYRSLGQYEQALLVLSKVVNDDAVSSLRLKAMFLRAEIYELQGRDELARKQLLTVSKKSGIWATKSQEKLAQTYGH